jgi:hypothetical protein
MYPPTLAIHLNTDTALLLITMSDVQLLSTVAVIGVSTKDLDVGATCMSVD